jgi:predicted dehydrogenase
MIRAGLIGLGKMGLSHQAILNAHPDIELAAVCDSSSYVLDVLNKYTGVNTYTDFTKMIAECALDCVVIATPSRFHAEMVRYALEQNLHVFCEKPFCLNLQDGQALVDLAAVRGRVNQVGYHFRYVGAFAEAKRLLQANVLGTVHHLRAEAYGPVVLRTSGSTWRSSKKEGGGCLYDYASHAIDLVNMLKGTPEAVGGVVLNRVFSRDVEDEVYATLYFGDGATGQLEANWSDESQRKMSTKITLWGTNGHMAVERQECRIYLRDAFAGPISLPQGWSVRYTTDLTEPVWYYLRGEEYSRQIDEFVLAIKGQRQPLSSFETALDAGRVIEAMLTAAPGQKFSVRPASAEQPRAAGRGLFGSVRKTLRQSWV